MSATPIAPPIRTFSTPLRRPADITELAEGAGSRGYNLPAGALQTRADFGDAGSILQLALRRPTNFIRSLT